MFEPSLADVLNSVVDKAARNTGVALPGTVVSYNAASQTCSVDPGVHRLVPSEQDEDIDEAEALPTIQDVPVIWPQGRNFNIVGTLSPGDPVLLVCLDRDPSGWLRTGQPAEPDDARVHHWGSAVAIPGLVPDTSPFPTQSDAAALASLVDKFLRAVSGLADATSPATAITAIQATILAARSVVGGGTGVPGTGTTASDVLKVSS